MSATQKLLRFGAFELNLESEELSKSGIPVKLPPQPLKLLALLAGHASQVVTRDQIQKELWAGETFVDFDHGVNKCINQIRTALGDNADHPLYIETLPRRGYRFVAPVISKTIPGSQPRIIDSDSGERTRLPVLIGGRTKAAAATAEMAASEPALLANATPAAEPVTAAEPARKARYRWSRIAWIGAAILLIAAAGGGLYWRWRKHKATVMSGKGTIVLAEFDNKTGEVVFDDTLRTGLFADLQQSPFLELISDERIVQTMALMNQPKKARVTPELAREICIRIGSTATLEGSIELLGKDYVVELRAVNCHSGDEIATQQFTVDSKEKILPALGNAVSQMRRNLGESVASLQQHNVPLADVTTPSLEALKAYTLAERANDDGDYQAAITLARRAVDLDPNFALGYVMIGINYNNFGLTDQGNTYLRKAYELRNHVGEREKFMIEAFYANSVTGNVEAARKTYQLWMNVYPNDLIPPTSLAMDETILGHYNDALGLFKQVSESYPKSPLSYSNLVVAYLYLDRLEEAETTAREATARHLDTPALHLCLYWVHFLEHDRDAMGRDKVAVMGKPGWEDQILDMESDTAAYEGHFQRARELTNEAVDSAERAKESDAAAAYKAEAAVREALVGNIPIARQNARAALGPSDIRDANVMSAVALALVGDTVQATRLANDLAKRFPENTIVRYNYLPTIQSAVAVKNSNVAKALLVLEPAEAYELGAIQGSASFMLYPVYLRGEAYLAMRQGNAAAAEFQKILNHPGVVVNEPIGALARLGLGRAYALEAKSDPAASGKARATYEDFLTLWKDADPDIPIYKQAKAEYAQLQ